MDEPIVSCLRCGGAMTPGFLDMRQATFPFEWVAVVPGLSGPGGRNVYGWGQEAEASKRRRAQQEASRATVGARRCAQCGVLELHAAPPAPSPLDAE